MILALLYMNGIVKQTFATLLIHWLNHNIDLIVNLKGGWRYRLFDFYLFGVKSKEYYC